MLQFGDVIVVVSGGRCDLEAFSFVGGEGGKAALDDGLRTFVGEGTSFVVSPTGVTGGVDGGACTSPGTK